MAESDTNSSWNAAKYQEKCEWDSSDPKFLETLANCTIKKSYKDGQFDDADESDETDKIYGTCAEHQEHTPPTEWRKDSMKSSVRKNHLAKIMKNHPDWSIPGKYSKKENPDEIIQSKISAMIPCGADKSLDKDTEAPTHSLENVKLEMNRRQVISDEKEKVYATVEDIPNLYENNASSQRYQLLVTVSSLAWIKNGKTSVWIEDPAKGCHGITIMCCFENSPCSQLSEDYFLEPWGQYIVTNALISVNKTQELPTFAKLQLLLDKHSKIEKVGPNNRWPLSFDFVTIKEIPKMINEDPGDQIDAKFIDIVAIPIEDLGGKHPRRIRMMDDTCLTITLTLWDDDALDEKRISKMMKRPITIRNGLCRFFPGFRGEWQIRKPLISILPYRSSPKAFCIERMKELYDWFNQVEIDY